MRINLANLPSRATAILSAYCSQKLDIEDESYCYRLPMAYVPAYLGNVQKFGKNDDQEPNDLQENQPESVVDVQDMEEMPVKTQSSGLWDISITIQGEGKIERLASLNHPIKVLTDANQNKAMVSL